MSFLPFPLLLNFFMQVVAMKLLISENDGKKYLERLNSKMPEDIRVLGFQRVIPSFDSRMLCDRRRYE